MCSDSISVWCLDSGVPVEDLLDQLGWISLATRGIYLKVSRRVVYMPSKAPANACAKVLTSMPSDDPSVIELEWNDEKPADDRGKNLMASTGKCAEAALA